jgi:hypothetical protein
MNPITSILQDVTGILQDVDKLLQEISGQKLNNLLDGCGNGSGGGAPSGTSNQGVSGSGTIWGDPHFTDTNGNQNYSVQGQAGNIYNLLSDTGIEVNGKFEQYSPGFNAVGELGINLNGDHIDIKPGQLTINGQTIDTSKPGSYLNGAVTVNKDGSITVKNDHYTLTVTSQSGGDSGKYLNTSITATDGGRLQQVGGLWGQSLETTKVDTNASDFQVSSLFSHQGAGGLGGGGGLDSIQTSFTPPTLAGNTITDALNYEKAIMEFSTEVNASTTALNTLGNAMKDAVSKLAQS